MSAPDTTGPGLLQFVSSAGEPYGGITAGGALSPWSRSWTKRAFDVAAVLAMMPILLPLLLVIAVVVCVTSRGPAIFRQTRIGRLGMPFTILKFRTMCPCQAETDGVVAPAASARVTAAGKLLRRWKLDELPQFLNVLRGDMSLIGPRPKIPAHQVAIFASRPGLSSPATLLFAREEALLARIPPQELSQYYREEVLPVKHEIDADYMSGATLWSDLSILVRTVCARWADGSALVVPVVARSECFGEQSEDGGLPPAIDLVRSN